MVASCHQLSDNVNWTTYILAHIFELHSRFYRFYNMHIEELLWKLNPDHFLLILFKLSDIVIKEENSPKLADKRQTGKALKST